MQFDFRATKRFMARHFVRLAWTTTQQKWTTAFALVGLAVATLVMPGIGIVVFGGAFAGWWVAVVLVTAISGLVGNRLGIGLEKEELLRARDRD